MKKESGDAMKQSYGKARKSMGYDKKMSANSGGMMAELGPKTKAMKKRSPKKS